FSKSPSFGLPDFPDFPDSQQNSYFCRSQNSKYMSQRTRIKALLESEQTDMEVVVKGWVRTFRNNQFIALNDGSTNNNLQIVVDFENTDPALLKRINTGAAISVTG